jgi:hypothetical protein
MILDVHAMVIKFYILVLKYNTLAAAGFDRRVQENP